MASSLAAYRGARRLLPIVLSVTVLGTAAGLLAVAPVAASTVVASDTFARRLSGGWGSADVGGTYRILGSGTAFTVNGSAGAISVPLAYRSQAAVLANAKMRDGAVSVAFTLPRLPLRGAARVSVLSRVVNDRSFFHARLRVAPTGAVRLAIFRVLDGASRRLGDSVTLGGMRVAAGQSYRLKLATEGVAPTTLSAKVWPSGSSEPKGFAIVRSSGASRLQQAGGVGLALSSSARYAPLPAVVRFDGLLATGNANTSPTNTLPSGDYMLLSRSHLMSLPTRGSAWDFVLATARDTWATPNTWNKDATGTQPAQQALAGALVYARTGGSAMREKVVRQIEQLYLHTPWFTSELALYRQIPGWVLAADLVGYRDSRWLNWLSKARTRTVGTHGRWYNMTLTHEDSPTNWGAFAGASRIAISVFLGDRPDLDRAWRVYRGFLGERSAWSGFQGQSSTPMDTLDAVWACDASPSAFVPVNPPCTRNGINLNGAIVRDASRDDRGLVWPTSTGVSYQLESLQGLIVQAELLSRHGYATAWQAGNGALKRIGDFVSRNGAAGGLTWNHSSVKHHVPWLMNARLNTSYPTIAARYGRAFGYTDWLYGEH